MITKIPNSRTLIVRPLGNLDALKVEHYRQELRGLLEQGYQSIIFDLEQVPYINSSGLGMLVEFHNSVKNQDGAFRLINCSEKILELLELTRLKVLLNGEGIDYGDSPRVQEFDPLHELMSEEMLMLSTVNQTFGMILNLEDPVEIGRTVLEQAIAATHATRGVILFSNESTQHLHLIHWKGNAQDIAPPPIDDYPLKLKDLAWEIIENHRVVWLERIGLDEEHTSFFRHLEFDTMLVAPIYGNKRNYGLIVLESSDRTQTLMKVAEPTLTTFTQMCGMALEKAALHQQTEMQKLELLESNNNLKKAHDSLMNAGRLASIGTVIYGIGHQLNNKLVPVQGYLQLLLQSKQLPEEVNKRLDSIRQASDEIQNMSERLIQLSRGRESQERSFDMHHSLQIAMDLLREQLHKVNPLLQLELAEKLPHVSGDPDLFLQALITVLHRSLSSFSANQSQRWVRIKTQSTEDGACVIVEDNGKALQDYDEEDWQEVLMPVAQIREGCFMTYNLPRRMLQRQRGAFVISENDSGGKHIRLELKRLPHGEN